MSWIHDASAWSGWDKMIDVNIRSHLYILGEFLPGMKERGTGHVVNITSDSEKEPFQNLAVYCGTKHFWTGFSAALRWVYNDSSNKRSEIALEIMSVD